MLNVEVFEEPRDDVWSDLLGFALQLGGTFSLVWQDSLPFSDTARAVEQTLDPHLIRTDRTSEWPGTCSSNIATVRFYSINAETIHVLRGSRGPYDWRSPDRPEDLALYDASDRCWFECTSHEEFLYLIVSEQQLAAVRARVPRLRARVVGEASPRGA